MSDGSETHIHLNAKVSIRKCILWQQKRTNGYLHFEQNHPKTLPNKVINLPKTYEKLHCKGETYQFYLLFT